ncbi:hypothetical protein Tco_0469740, partial [Tanacetum coccineum]
MDPQSCLKSLQEDYTTKMNLLRTVSTDKGVGEKNLQGMNEKGAEEDDEQMCPQGEFISPVCADHVENLEEQPVNDTTRWEDPKVNNMKASFANVVSTEQTSTKLNFRTLISNTHVEGSDCVLPVENFTLETGLEKVLEQGPWMIRNQPLFLTKWTPNLALSKDNVTKPILLDAFTSSMCKDPWSRIGYARTMIEISAEKDLNREVKMAIPIIDGEGYTMETMKVEYDRKPPCCSECHVFGHADEQCPKRVVEAVKETNVDPEEGFTTVRNRKRKGKKVDNGQPRHIEGLILNKPRPNYVWNVKVNQPTKPKPIPKSHVDADVNYVKLNNAFTALQEQDEILSVNNGGESSKVNDSLKVMENSDATQVDSDSEVEETYTEFDTTRVTNKGASTPSTDWTSNASLCAKGCRIILGWNKDVVDVLVLAQSHQAIHAELGIHKHVVRRALWILMGDFNVALNIEDTFTGSSSMNAAMCEFKDCVTNIEVFDINSFGIHFTWNQKPKGSGGVLKKLDRIMGNIGFVDMFPSAYAMFHPYRISDHSPSVLKIPSLSNAKPMPFKFFNFLAHKEGFLEVVSNQWKNHIEGHSMYQVVQTLKSLKKPFRKLMHDQGNLHERVNRLRDELDVVQKALDQDPSNSDLRDEEAVYLQAFNDAKIDEECFLRQKAKIEWLEVGDSNSAYFHKTIKNRNQRSRIDVITNSNNVEVTGNHIPNVFVLDYKDFLGTDMNCDDLDSDGLFQTKVSDTVNENMMKPVTNDEIKKAMFGIGDDKDPGLDGFTSAFFKKGWDVVGQDMYYYPHQEVVSDNQSAFVPGRRISDNILITQELMHNYHWDRGPPRCAFIVDIQKAYDTVDWGFLDHILKGFGFHPSMIKWIMACVTSTSFSLSINGEIHGFLKENGSSARYHKQCEELNIINVCFADDLFIFARGDVESAKVIMESLNEFKNVSGLDPSIPKSTIFFCNVLNYVKIAILNIMSFSKGKLPVKYLGVPLISFRLFNRDCKILVENVHNRIGDWKNKSLSFAGRLQLCKLVIYSMQVYWATVLVIPKGIWYDIQQLIRCFLWCNGEYKRGKAKVAWEDICLPKCKGGLGLRSLEVFNLALMTTHVWNIISCKESLWVRWIHMYKLRGSMIWDVHPKGDMSWSWRKILQLRE